MQSFQKQNEPGNGGMWLCSKQQGQESRPDSAAWWVLISENRKQVNKYNEKSKLREV